LVRLLLSPLQKKNGNYTKHRLPVKLVSRHSPPALSPAVAQRCFEDWERLLSGGVSIATKGEGECKGMEQIYSTLHLH